MTAIIDGVYEHGRIELRQPPANLPEGRVRVIVIAEDPVKPAPRQVTFGMYPGDASTLEDFKVAQWHGETEWNDRWIARS
jgi:hypothetical protein